MLYMSHLSRAKMSEWARRYLPATLVALVVSTVVFVVFAPTNALVAAYVASVIDTLIYYGIILSRDFKGYWSRVEHTSLMRIVIFIRAILVEFGPAEILDTYVVRPALLYATSITFGTTFVVVALALLLADLLFHAIAVIGYEAHKRTVREK